MGKVARLFLVFTSGWTLFSSKEGCLRCSLFLRADFSEHPTVIPFLWEKGDSVLFSPLSDVDLLPPRAWLFCQVNKANFVRSLTNCSSFGDIHTYKRSPYESRSLYQVLKSIFLRARLLRRLFSSPFSSMCRFLQVFSLDYKVARCLFFIVWDLMSLWAAFLALPSSRVLHL